MFIIANISSSGVANILRLQDSRRCSRCGRGSSEGHHSECCQADLGLGTSDGGRRCVRLNLSNCVDLFTVLSYFCVTVAATQHFVQRLLKHDTRLSILDCTNKQTNCKKITHCYACRCAHYRHPSSSAPMVTAAAAKAI